MNTDHLTDAEYKLFERLISSGHRVNPEQIKTCPHCLNAYKVANGAGASINHCADEACRLARRAAEVRDENRKKQERRKVKILNKSWKHDHSRKECREREILESAAGFSYV